MSSDASPPPVADRPSAPADNPMRARRVAALAILVVAVAALAQDHLPFNWREAALVLLGVAFIVWAGLARTSGLLIPGCILIGVGTGIVLRPHLGGTGYLFSLAGGFLLIPLLSLAMFGKQKNLWWPLFPAAGLALAGLFQVAGRDLRQWLTVIGPYWPFAAIAVAVWLFFSKPSPKL